MKIRKVSEVEQKVNPHGVEARQLYSNGQGMVMHLTLNPGDIIPPHPSSMGACFLVLEGNGIVTIGDEKSEAGPGTVIESPPGTPHGWHNNTGGSLKIVVFKTG